MPRSWPFGRSLPLLALAAASCNVGPDYARPSDGIPAAYKSATAEDLKAPVLGRDWWKLFGDSTLSGLEERASQLNQDLKAAAARIQEARASLRITDAGFYPSVTAQPQAERLHTSAHGSPTGAPSITYNTFTLPVTFAYELDVWGKIRRASESSAALLDASVDDYHVILNGLQADLAQDYFSIRSLDRQEQILKKSVDLYRQQLTLLNAQLQAGIVARITVAQQEALLYATLAQEVDVRRQRADLEHAIAILIGVPPSEFTLPPSPLDVVPPAVPSGIPAFLLRHRPDVAEAERRLASSSAQIGVAVSAYYPDFNLTALGGLQSVDLQHLLSWQSRIWTLAASATQPIFEGGKLDAQVELARAQYRESLANYRSAVLGAFRDVEDALTDLHLRAEEAEAQRKAVDASREYVSLSQVQFQQGIVNYLTVIDALRTMLSNELADAQLQALRMGSAVLLIKALGAGWDDSLPPTPVDE